jgi:ATP-dependent DNA helicase RecQ
MRPVPIFAYGYLAMEPAVQEAINKQYYGAVVLKDANTNVCEVNLKRIWENSYKQFMSYPKFKYLLYTGSDDLDFNKRYKFSTAMSVEISFGAHATEEFDKIFAAVKEFINESVRNNVFVSEADMINAVAKTAGISKFKAENIVNVVLAAISSYGSSYATGMNSRLYESRLLKENVSKYKFNPASRDFLYWIERGYKTAVAETKDGYMYVVNNNKNNRTKEILSVLGVLESFGVLRFKSLGGTNSQIYIYVNETKYLRMVNSKPGTYKNRLLNLVTDRHKESVKMLTYIFQNKFSSDEVWELLENYFLGVEPEELQ